MRRLVGYGRFEGIEAARVLARLYAAARLDVNFFQPSFKLKEKRRQGLKALPRAVDSLRASSGTSSYQQGYKTQASRDTSRLRSGRIAE